jgi:Obg family GTPase CgtA-like protein
VAYVDTAGRVPIVTREAGAYVIEYAALKYVASVTRRWPVETPEGRRRLMRTFEKFGLSRALLLAGAAPGARVRLGALEIDWQPPEDAAEGALDGRPGFEYVVARPIARLSPEQLRAEAGRVTPLLLSKLVKA